MTDVTQPEAQKAQKDYGSNQKIGIYCFSVPMLLTFGLCVLAGARGESPDSWGASVDKWIMFAQIYVPIAMATILGISGGLKTIGILKGGK